MDNTVIIKLSLAHGHLIIGNAVSTYLPNKKNGDLHSFLYYFAILSTFNNLLKHLS